MNITREGNKLLTLPGRSIKPKNQQKRGMKKMKAIKLEKPWDVNCVEMEKPAPGKGQALIRVMTAGICGSGIGAFRGTNGLVS